MDPTGSEQLALALAAVEANAEVTWLDAALKAVAKVCEQKPFFIVDDVWKAFREQQGTFADAGTLEPRAMGAVMKRAAAARYCEITDAYKRSDRPACHKNPRVVWRSIIYRGALN